jgi:hypothetical protein
MFTIQKIKNIIDHYKNLYGKHNLVYRGSCVYKKRLYPRKYRNSKYIFGTTSAELAISYMRCKKCDYIAQSYDGKRLTLLELKKNKLKKCFSCIGYFYIMKKSNFIKSSLGQLKTEYLSTKIQKPLCILKIKNPYHLIKSCKKIRFISSNHINQIKIKK